MPTEPRSRRSILGLPWSVALLAVGAMFTNPAQAEQTIAEDLTVQGVLKIDDPATAPMLYFQGTPASGVSTGAVGASISYLDGTIGSITYKINRLGAEWQWQVATSNPLVDRLQMKLDDGSVLSLFDPANSANKIQIVPGGVQPGVFVNSVRLATVNEVVPVVSGGLSVSGTGAVSIGSRLDLPASTDANHGVIYQNGNRLFHSTGGNNLFFGGNAGSFVASGTGNVGIGQNVLQAVTTGGANIGLGQFSMQNLTSGEQNVALGLGAMMNAIDASYNVAVGSGAMWQSNSGMLNVAVGSNAMYTNSSGSENTAVGVNVLYCNTQGGQNVALGHYAGFGNTLGGRNTALGFNALFNNTVSSHNVAVGAIALTSNTAEANTGIGSYALENSTTGAGNVAVGFLTMNKNITGAYNVAVGSYAGQYPTSGSYNTYVGTNAGEANVGGTNNTFVGSGSNGWVGNLSNATAIGAGAVVSQSDSLVLGNNAKVGIGTTTPQAKLEVVGDLKVSGPARFDDRIRVAPRGDIGMGDFTAEPTP